MTPDCKRPQRGAALLLAMLILTLVSTLAAGMVWQQWRAVQVESAERARAQSSWMLTGALDWARLILREDKRSQKPTALGEPWSMPLAEARLSTFLAQDRDNNTDSGPEAFLSGSIRDAQSRYNLRNLVSNGQVQPAELKTLARLCEIVGAPGGTAEGLALRLQAAWPALPGAPVASAPEGAGSTPPPPPPPPVDEATRPLAPRSVDQLRWLGVDAAALKALAPYVELLPVPTPLNLNTAGREVLAAVVPGLDLGSAERVLQARQRKAFESLDEALRQLPAGTVADPKRMSVASDFFEVLGRMRLEDRVLEERSLVERRGLEIVALQRERRSSHMDTP